MTALAHPLPVETLEALVGEGVRRALEGESVAGLARELWYIAGRQFADELGPRGLAHMINARMSSVRGGAVEAIYESDVAVGRPPAVKGKHHALEMWRRKLANPYQAADGTLRPLLTFTVGDAKYLAALSHAHAVPLVKMRDAMELAAEYLETAKAVTIADLPPAKQQEIGEALI